MIKEIRELFSVAIGDADQTTVAQFSEAGDVDALLRDKMNAYCDISDPYCDPSKKNEMFAMIAESVVAELPKAVDTQFRGFVTVKTYKWGDAPRLEIDLGEDEVKKFVTRGAQAGVYRKATMDKGFVELDHFTISGGIRVSLRDFLTGFISAQKLRSILIAQFTTNINMEIQKLLQSLYAGLPAANKHTASSLVEAELDKIVATVDAYCKGNSRPVIFCTKRFAATLPPASTTYDAQHTADIRSKGYSTMYKGCDVVILEQSFTDKTNATKVTDDKYCYILPMDKSRSLIHLGLEGKMVIDEHTNRGTQSKEYQAWQNAGLAAVYTNHLGLYINSGL